MEPVVAILFDCDGTLTEDSTDFLLRQYGVDTNAFWPEVSRMVRQGWDPPLAYLSKILLMVEQGKMGDLTRDRMRQIGSQVPTFKGVPDVFDHLRRFVNSVPEFVDAHVNLEYYIVSSGIEQVIFGMDLSHSMTGIFGCEFEYNDATGLPVRVKRSVTFTEKTKFVFAVNKGIGQDEMKSEPYRVNDSIDERERRVPLERMIYVGDGPSDIPCFSLIMKNRGHGVGVYRKAKKGYELARGKRITAGPFSADYSQGSDLREFMQEAILDIAYNIVTERKLKFRAAPAY